MTSEVAVLNRSAVAIAADSAATIGGKVFNSANKIFALSRHYPVGIMIYGNAEFLGVPWETIVNLYRERYSDSDLSTIAEHSNRFFRFIEIEAEIFSDQYIKADTRYRLNEYAQSIFRPIYDVSIRPQKSRTRLRKLIGKRIDSDFKKFNRYSYVEGFTKQKHDELKVRLDDVLEGVITDNFGDSISSDRRRRKLKNILGSYLTKEWSSQGDTGIVITGFGSDQHFPAICSYECRGMQDGVIWRIQKNSETITEQTNAILVPFAQIDVTAAFVEGLDPELRQTIEKFMRAAFAKLKQATRTKGFNDRANEILETFLENFSNYRIEKHVTPILETLRFLPKDELAKLAESLVEITSLKRHVSEETETVGGPIDVAVISRGEGFVWISRKHYFDAAINQDYLLRRKLGERRPGQ